MIAALVGACVVVAGAWWALSSESSEPPLPAVTPTPGVATVEEPPEAVNRTQQLAPIIETDPVSEASSTVAWPVKVELELVRAAHLPKVKGLAPLGSGAVAKLRGRLSRGDVGVRGQVTFIGGPNLGRVLDCTPSGDFGALDLYPGLAEVRITGPGVESVRELRLRANSLAELNISYDLPGSLTGQVFDREARPLASVDVELDGQHVRSDENGLFHFPTAPGGDAVRLVLRKEGFATQAHTVGVAAGRELGKEHYTYTLQPAAKLAIQLGPRVGGAGDATVLIAPEVLGPNRVYPWQRVSPLRMAPGATHVIDDLPAMRVSVRVFHEGALAQPELATVFLRTGETERHEVRFEPGPSVQGVVVDEQGRRVENALVVCEAADRTAATLQYLADMPAILEAEITPPLPIAAGQARTNFNGEFQLSTWPRFGAMRYLWAESADGRRWGGRAIATGESSTVELVVRPIQDGQWSVSLDFPGRHQGVPVVVSVAGAARPEVTVPAREPLVLRGLAAGTWRVRAWWNGKPLLGPEGDSFELDGDHTHSIALPEGAIAGQDEDTLLRAGRIKDARTN